MKVICVDLGTGTPIAFGPSTEIRCHLARPEEAIENGTVVVAYSGGGLLYLPSAAQIRGQTQIFVVFGTVTDRLLVVGGPKLYLINDSGSIITCVSTKRVYEWERLWETVIEPVKEGVLVVYERDMVFIEGILNVRWHMEKEHVDMFLGVDEDRNAVLLVRDHEEDIFVSLRTGRPI